MYQAVSDFHTRLNQQCKDRYTAWVGLLALTFYAFFWLFHLPLSGLGEVFLVLPFLYVLATSASSGVRRDPILWLFVAWVLFQVGVHLWAVEQFPEIAAEQVTVARHYTKVFLLVIVAWWFAGSSNAVVLAFFLAFLGFLAGVLSSEQSIAEAFQLMLEHKRITLGYRNWEHLSVYSAFFLMVLIFFRKRVLGFFAGRWQWLGYLLVVLWLLLVLFGIVASMTRATWLGLLVSLPMVALIYLGLRRKKTQRIEEKEGGNMVKNTIIAVVTVAALLVLFIKADVLNLVERRLNAESEVIEMIIAGDLDNVPISSIGIRIHTWRKAIGWIQERPWTGWGPKSRKALYAGSDLPPFIKKRFGHFHNSYIEVTLAYGLIGLAVFMLVFGVVGYRAWWAWRRGIMPDDVFLFLVAFTIYWLIVNIFESYVIYTTGYYLNALVGGAAYTFYLASRQKKRQVDND